MLNKEEEKTDENSGHYVIASSRPPERRPLERRMLAPKRSMDTQAQEVVNVRAQILLRMCANTPGVSSGGKWFLVTD